MAKLLLVEDDNNLREIYEARLQAEGYTIVSAKDGEEALVVAKAEKPDLVISDVMMPKISGFEMLDIMRNTDELKHVKVIMLTALGQSDDQQRADKLGADRYLVKSQVTLEDIVKVTHELLQDEETAAADTVAAASPAPKTDIATPATDDAAPKTDTPAPAVEPAPVPEPAPVSEPAPKPEPDTSAPKEAAKSTVQEEADVEAKIEDFVAGASSEPTTPADSNTPAAPTTSDDTAGTDNTAAATDDKLMADAVEQLAANPDKNASETAPKSTTIPVSIAPDDSSAAPSAPVANEPAKAPEPTTGSGSVSHNKIITPLEGSAPKKDIKELLADEEAKEAQPAPGATVTSDAPSTEDAEDRPAGQAIATPGSVMPTGSKDTPGEVDPNSIAL
jgi:CheY-like chemotaxis protein